MTKRIQTKLPIFLGATCALMMVLVFVICNITVYAANISTSVANLGASDVNGSFSGSGTTISGSVTGKDATTGCNSTPASSATDTLTLTNNFTTAATLSFSYSPTVNGGSVTVDGSSKTSSGTFSKELAASGTVEVVITSATGAKTTSISLTNITLEQKIVTATTTFTPATNGSYTVDGTAVTSEISRTQASTQAYTLSATPATGYVFGGWKDVTNNTIISADNPASICVDTDKTITAVFSPDDSAKFKVGSKTFNDLNAADAYASSQSDHKIILISNGKDRNALYEGNYQISSGNTLLIPFDSSNTMYTTSPSVTYGSHENPTAYRILSMENGANITVKSGGAISVSGKLCSTGQLGGWNGCPTGPGGRINMLTGSNITLESNGNLYCWGYIYGGGMVEAKSGATVYEAFQVKDWRGGSETRNCYGYVFPFNQYYVQNIEVPLKIDSGAAEKLYGAVNASSSAYTLQADFIGSGNSSAMFRVSSGYVIKDYLENTDQLSVQVHGNVTLSTLTVSGLPLIGSVDTSDYDLPITNNIKIDIQTDTVSTGQDVKFQPGSEVYIERGAKFQVSSGKKAKVYDLADWDNFTGSAKMYAIGYSVANGTTAVRSPANMSDVTIDVNGIMEVAGSLYTSASGANITSSLGSSGNNGKIVFTTAPTTSTVTVYEDANNSTKTAVTFSAPQLHNGNDTYSQAAGTGTSTWYYDKDGEHWYRYTVDFNYNGARVGRDYYCENNDTITYDASYLANLGVSLTSGTATVAVSGSNVNVTNVTSNSVVTLTGQAAKFIPTFVLNEHQAQNYETFTSTALTDTRIINGDTYYVVKKAEEALDIGASFAAPTDAEMGVTAQNFNGITWNMSGVSATSGNNYAGTVPVGPNPEDEVYIYGFYTGSVAYNSTTDTYYSTLAEAMAEVPQDGECIVRLVNDCGSFEEENGAWAFPNPAATTLTFDLNGYHALGRIINNGTMTLELNGGTLDYHTGATAAAATYKGLAAVINSGTMTINDTVGDGEIITDAISNDSGPNGSAVVRNNAGATLTVTGKDAEHLLPLSQTQNVNGNNYGIYNLGTITALTNVDISTKNSGTCGLNLYNYNTGVITAITGGHMFCNSNCSIFNYGGTITAINGMTIDGKNGIVNRNIVGGKIATGYTVSNADKGIIDTITNCNIEVGQYAINNHAVINTLTGSTFIAHPDSAQVDTRGNGSTASEGNVQCYTVVNNNDWWYNTNVWKQVDSSSGGYTRVNYYKEEEQYRPTIGTITNCEIYALNTSTSTSYGYALMNYGVIDTIGGTTNVKTYKHPDNAKISVSHYAMQNLNGGIIKSIEGTVNADCTGVGAVYNDAAFTTQINYTYANKVGGNITYQKNTYGEPSTINSITCSGTWSCGGSSSYYYALMNSGYIQSINSTGLTMTGGCNVLYNATGSANSTYEITKKYTDGATASTEYERDTHYVKNLEKGSTIGTVNGITITGKGSKSYYVLNNQGHIGTLSNTTVNFAEGATHNTSYYVAALNGDSRYKEYTETIQTNRTAETDPHLTVSAGVVTRYDRAYKYDTPTIDVIDNLTVDSITAYAMRNAGHIGTLKNSTITGTQYSLHNYAAGPYTERQTRQYYSGTGIFTTSKNAGELNIHYKRNPAEIDLIDNCTITTPANTYAMFNSGHVGTIKNSTLQAGTTTAKAYALANMNSQEREYTRDLESILYVTANSTTACTAYYGSGGESDVVTYDYDVPTIDLIGEGNTFKATASVIANTGTITEINSGNGPLTTITGSAAKYSSIYNYSACLDARTTTTPYTAAASANASGTKGTATYDDVYQSGAQIGTIKNVYVNANGYGILNGDGNAGKTPTIGEIGDGTEIYAHCTTAAYHAIANANYAKITEISGGLFKVTKATTNAYRNGNSIVSEDIDYATLLSGGYFQGASNTRDNAIYNHSVATRVTYPTGKKLSSGTTTPTPVHTDTMGGNYYYIADEYTVTFDMQGHGTAPDSQTVESGLKATQPTAPAVGDIITENGVKYRFDGWYTNDTFATAFSFDNAITANTTVYAKWTEVYTVTWKNGDTVIETDENVPAGTAPSYDGTMPTKNPTAQYSYEFDGWTSSLDSQVYAPSNLPAVNANVIYTAHFTQTERTYNVTWIIDGTTEKETYTYGATPTHADPTKASTVGYDYTFNGWTPEITTVTADATYTAVFTESAHKFFIGNTLTLNGDIGVNFFVELSSADTDASKYSYTLTFDVDTSEGSKEEEYIPAEWENVLLSSAVDVGSNTYKISFPVDAAEMTRNIHIDLYHGEAKVAETDYKAAQYAMDYAEEKEITYPAYDTELTDNTPYLIGKIKGVSDWANANPMYKFTDNPENPDEYMLANVTLKAGDEIKVVKYYTGSDSYGWYPDGDNNNYTVSNDGVYNIYFKKNPDGYTDGWHHGKFLVEAVSTDRSDIRAAVLPELLRSMLSYASKAQVNLNKYTGDLADRTTGDYPYLNAQGVYNDVTDAMITERVGEPIVSDNFTDMFSSHGLSYYGNSLLLKSNTQMRFYYRVNNRSTFDINNCGSYTMTMPDGTSQSVKPKVGNKSGSLVYFEVSGIAAANLDYRYVLSDGENSIGYSTLDYVRLCLNDGDSLEDVTKALFWYNQYADLYFAS
ncbi:MAG: InlB B-repeat-containing protein [Ruminococcus sp.]|nr:InlB B-repeat-containing protein [Ruminococcus sp.]